MDNDNLADKTEGKVKETVGAATDDKSLETEGKAQQVKAEVSDKARELGEKAKESGAEFSEKMKEAGADISEKASELGGRAKEEFGEIAGNVKHAAEQIIDSFRNKEPTRCQTAPSPAGSTRRIVGRDANSRQRPSHMRNKKEGTGGTFKR